MIGRFSAIPGKDVTIENLGYCQTKPTSSKLFHTQTSIQRVLFSLLFVSINLPCYHTVTLKICNKTNCQGRSQKFILVGYNYLLHDTTVLYILASGRHRLQLVQKIIFRD